ncbi:MAG: hypothetical protein HC895_19345 [Leptolyngbyaceae cyanobacterium SM1_3_5]|nr:hypothetical protein [Leptolyngbyaceae cyanobacterium SM1_3_5]
MPAKSTNQIGAFIVGRLLAERAGLSSAQATQWGAVLMATGLSPASILLVSELARLDAANLAAQADRQIQLQAAIEQAARNSQAAIEKLEQVTVRLDQLSDRLGHLEAQTSDTSNQATCTEILAALRELRDGQDAWCDRSAAASIDRWLRHLVWRFRKFWTRLPLHHRPHRRKNPHSR